MPFSAILFALAAAHPAVLQAGWIGDDDYSAATAGGVGNPVAEWQTQKINWKLPITAAAAASADIASAKRKAEVKVQVAKDGSIDSCEVVTPSGDPKFDLTACRFLGQFGKLDIIRNAAGRPIRSTRIVPVWQ